VYSDANPTTYSLEAALSPDFRLELGITHILSICPDYTSTGPNHLTIPVDDFEYEDILVHLPQSCQFVQTALDEGGKVLVHCQMGVSRSPTVVCAYRTYHSLIIPRNAINW
jgi:dual specificity phosphatase 12